MKMRNFNESEQRSLAAAIAYQGILRLKIAVPLSLHLQVAWVYVAVKCGKTVALKALP